MISILRPLPALLLLALPVLGETQQWVSDLEAGLRTARKEGRQVLLLFTVGDACPNCSALRTEVFATDAWKARADRFVHVEVPYRHQNQRAHQVLMATARLEMLPTIVLLDPDGWPYLSRGGFERGGAAALIGAIDAAAKDVTLPRRLRDRCEAGYRELLAWYRKGANPFGETLTLGALFPHGTRAERLQWAPPLLAVATAREGALAKKPYLSFLEQHDRSGRKGRLSRGLLLAGRQLLGLAEDAAAGRCFLRVVDLKKAPRADRMEASVYAGHAYCRLDAPCLARHHFSRAARAPAGDEAGDRWRVHARKRLSALPKCPAGCGCARKRL